MKLLLVDYNNALFKSLFIHKHFYFDGMFTGGLFGVLNQIVSCNRFCGVDAIIVFKDEKPYIRSEYYDDYKSNRTALDIDIKTKYYESSNLLDEFFNVVGIPVVSMEGYEADDLIAMAVKGEFADVIIALSNDSDLYQLFNNKTPFYMYKGKDGLFYKESLENMYGVKGIHKKWAEILAYSGGHNNLVGIRGVGIKTAIKIVLGGKKIALTKREKALVARNLYLTTLPIGTVKGKVQWEKVYKLGATVKRKVDDIGDAEKMEILRFFKKYGLETFVMDCDKFIEFNKVVQSEYGSI